MIGFYDWSKEQTSVVRISKESKEFIKKAAQKKGASQMAMIELIIKFYRTAAK